MKFKQSQYNRTQIHHANIILECDNWLRVGVQKSPLLIVDCLMELRFTIKNATHTRYVIGTTRLYSLICRFTSFSTPLIPFCTDLWHFIKNGFEEALQVIVKYQTVKDGTCPVYRFELTELNIVCSHHTLTSIHKQTEMARPFTVQQFHHHHHHHHHRHRHHDAASSIYSMKSSL
uniref:Uncharacterized protein n=1 Tax=Glossina pallidipes TaxID=7398 RepID=A0A1A9ZBQ3_GLOPL